MSAGAFTDTFYTSNVTGSVHPIRVQTETLALVLGGVTNAAPAGTGAVLPSAQVSQGKRSLGINARKVSIRLTAALAGYQSGAVISVPWMNPTTFDALVPKVTTGTYLATACIVVGTSPEKTN